MTAPTQFGRSIERPNEAWLANQPQEQILDPDCKSSPPTITSGIAPMSATCSTNCSPTSISGTK